MATPRPICQTAQPSNYAPGTSWQLTTSPDTSRGYRRATLSTTWSRTPPLRDAAPCALIVRLSTAQSPVVCGVPSPISSTPPKREHTNERSPPFSRTCSWVLKLPSSSIIHRHSQVSREATPEVMPPTTNHELRRALSQFPFVIDTHYISFAKNQADEPSCAAEYQAIRVTVRHGVGTRKI